MKKQKFETIKLTKACYLLIIHEKKFKKLDYKEDNIFDYDNLTSSRKKLFSKLL